MSAIFFRVNEQRGKNWEGTTRVLDVIQKGSLELFGVEK